MDWWEKLSEAERQEILAAEYGQEISAHVANENRLNNELEA